MEIKTCEEYVLAELDRLQNEKDKLQNEKLEFNNKLAKLESQRIDSENKLEVLYDEMISLRNVNEKLRHEVSMMRDIIESFVCHAHYLEKGKTRDYIQVEDFTMNLFYDNEGHMLIKKIFDSLPTPCDDGEESK